MCTACSPSSFTAGYHTPLLRRNFPHPPCIIHLVCLPKKPVPLSPMCLSAPFATNLKLTATEFYHLHHPLPNLLYLGRYSRTPCCPSLIPRPGGYFLTLFLIAYTQVVSKTDFFFCYAVLNDKEIPVIIYKAVSSLIISRHTYPIYTSSLLCQPKKK